MPISIVRLSPTFVLSHLPHRCCKGNSFIHLLWTLWWDSSSSRLDWNECNLVNVWFCRLVFRHDKRYEQQWMSMEMNKFDSDLDIGARETENLLIFRTERN